MKTSKLNKNQINNPRYDLYTGELLPYKSKDFYENSLYINRTNLINHFKQIDKDKAFNLTIEILSNRKKVKGLIYTPSTIELRTIIAPSIALLEKIGIDYSEICSEIHLEPRYKYDGKFLLNNRLDKIFIDSREQNPLKFPSNIATEIKGLKVGDYSKCHDLTNQLVVERKNLSDFIQTLSSGFERFHKELNRAEELNAKVLMIVEAKFSQAISFNYLPHLKRHIKATPEFIFSRAREIIQNYSNFQIIFVDGREEASLMTLLALNEGVKIMDFDLQHLYDTNKIIL